MSTKRSTQWGSIPIPTPTPVGREKKQIANHCLEVTLDSAPQADVIGPLQIMSDDGRKLHKRTNKSWLEKAFSLS